VELRLDVAGKLRHRQPSCVTANTVCATANRLEQQRCVTANSRWATVAPPPTRSSRDCVTANPSGDRGSLPRATSAPGRPGRVSCYCCEPSRGEGRTGAKDGPARTTRSLTAALFGSCSRIQPSGTACSSQAARSTCRLASHAISADCWRCRTTRSSSASAPKVLSSESSQPARLPRWGARATADADRYWENIRVRPRATPSAGSPHPLCD